MKKAVNIGAAIFVMGAILIAVIEGARSLLVPVPQTEHQYCLDAAQQAGNKKPDCPTHETIWEAGLSDPVAYFTVWITVFTGAIAIASLWQGALTRGAIRLARDEFNASHPPDLVVREVRLDWIDKGGTAQPVVAFTLRNRGGRRCKVVESVLRRSDDGADVPDSTGINEIGRGILLPGRHTFVHVPLLGDGGQVLLGAVDMGIFEDQFFHGVIVFEDDDGVRRRMVFKRLCKRDSGRSFLATGNPADEYTD